MPKIEIRPAVANDIPGLITLVHSYETEYVWQMDLRHDDDQNQFTTSFRRVKLPRIVRSAYPRSPDLLLGDWTARAGLLVALHMDQTVGYISLSLNIAPSSTWVTDLVVHDRMRRKGIGSALVLASLEWARNHATRYLILEMQPKNYPAIKLAQKFGFDFCGYNDRYYANQDIGLFFAKSIR